jgi:hypothetical protein
MAEKWYLFQMWNFVSFYIKHTSYMRYLLTILIFSLLSCDKDSVSENTNGPLPTVTKLEVSAETINGVARPKFTITLDVPDAAAVSRLEIYQNARFPVAKSGNITAPNSGQYTVIDSSSVYPPSAAVKYFAFFTMKNYSYVSYYPFDVK